MARTLLTVQDEAAQWRLLQASKGSAKPAGRYLLTRRDRAGGGAVTVRVTQAQAEALMALTLALEVNFRDRLSAAGVVVGKSDSGGAGDE